MSFQSNASELELQGLLGSKVWRLRIVREVGPQAGIAFERSASVNKTQQKQLLLGGA